VVDLDATGADEEEDETKHILAVDVEWRSLRCELDLWVRNVERSFGDVDQVCV
jgi:hypothetical protein